MQCFWCPNNATWQGLTQQGVDPPQAACNVHTLALLQELTKAAAEVALVRRI